MSDQGIIIPSAKSALATSANPPARPVEARTKLLLEGPIYEEADMRDHAYSTEIDIGTRSFSPWFLGLPADV
jgi:hypothetical protein